MLIVAVTGGIGSGKSTTVELFKKHNIPVIDTDLIARELVNPGCPALAEIASTFGHEFINNDGTLNRRKLRNHIFADKNEREKLESILHPLIHQRVLDEIKNLDAPYCLLVIPLLAETRNQYPYNRVLVIDVERHTQLNRTMTRDNLDEATVNNILGAQISREQRLAIATDIIDNTGDLEQLTKQVNMLHEKYMALATRPVNT